MKPKSIAVLFALAAAALFQGCVSSGMESRLRVIENRQDSILAVLRTMQSQSEFVALRVGWRPPPDTTPQQIPLEGSFSKGPADAAITLVEFSDLQCPYCAQLAPVLDSVLRAYPRDVRLVFKHYPLSFHPQARAAAAAAIAAGNQGKFFEFRRLVAPHFRSLNDSLYLAAAQEIGLDMRRFRREMALTPEVNKILDQDMALGQRVGVEGTPTIFINGRLAEDRSLEYFAGAVERARAKR